MKKLLIYLKDYKKESILGPLFKLLEASFELMVPLIMATIIDEGIGNGNKGYILKMGMLLIALGVTGLISSLIAQYFAAKAAVGFSAKLREALFTHIQGLSYTELDKIGTSTMITRMTSDINQVQSGVNLVLRLFLRSPFMVMGAIIMAFSINVKAALVFVIMIPLLSIVVFGIMFLSIPMYRKVQEKLDKVLGITRENLTGVRVIRAFSKEQEEFQSFEVKNHELTKLQNFVGRFSAAMNPVTYIIVNGGLICLLWTGAIQVDGGFITQGAVVALVSYMAQILIELIKLANLIIAVTKAIASGNRIESVFEIAPSMECNLEKDSLCIVGEVHEKDKKNNEDIIVSFENLGFTYGGASEEALSNINLKIKKGQMIGIIGGTGSGKTTLVNMMPRFYNATKGKIEIDGVNVQDYSVEVLREKIGVVPQKAVLFKGTIRENIRWGKESATEEEIWNALELSQAKEFVEEKVLKLDEMISQGGKNLSGGQRQRLTIARALVGSPEILILDDSSSALDYATDLKLRQAIRTRKDSLTLFVVSQRAASIQNADQIVVMDDGFVSGIGTHSELLESCTVYQEIYNSQFRNGGISS
ncbi:MAG TPA: ABC transporter ATP-binding protein [Lachnospiraceae bacterium]|nr:ABC transporter ATP-binding protein [Lachnospiraceae bacterium]